MIIGVDAGVLAVHDDELKVGVYRAVKNLLTGLGKIDKYNSYRLYSFSPIPGSTVGLFGPRMQNIVLRPSIGWHSVRLPIELARRPVDVFLGLSQALPPLTNTFKIGFIYDLGFLQIPKAYPLSYHRLARQTKEVVNRANHIITISNTTKRTICTYYHVPETLVNVAYPGVEGIFSPRGKKHTELTQYLLFVGSVKQGKNVAQLLHVFAKLLESISIDCNLIIIGSRFWANDEAQEIINTYQLTNRVKILGFLEDTVLSQYYRGAKAFVSLSLVEGFCLPAIEAMASGCPVVVSDIEVFREVVGSAGLLVDLHVEDTIVRSLRKILIDGNFRNVLSKKGIARSIQYSWKSYAQKTLEVIHLARY